MSIGLKERFGAEKPVIAMAHLPPMPGTPLYDEVGGANAIVESVRRDVSGPRMPASFCAIAGT